MTKLIYFGQSTYMFGDTFLLVSYSGVPLYTPPIVTRYGWFSPVQEGDAQYKVGWQ